MLIVVIKIINKLAKFCIVLEVKKSFYPGTSCLRIHFSTKILSLRRGSGGVGVGSGPEKNSWEIGNYGSLLRHISC